MTTLLKLDPNQSTRIQPAFPSWEKSFVSGPASTLFKVIHSISNEDPKVLFTRTRFLPHAEGPPGHVHGGASAGLLDEVMGILVWHLEMPSVTQSIEVQFKRPVPLHEECLILTRLESQRKGKISVSSTLFDSMNRANVTAKGIFHLLTREQLERFK